MKSDEAPKNAEQSSNQNENTRGQFRYRPLIILLFAAILLCVSSVAKSQEPQLRIEPQPRVFDEAPVASASDTEGPATQVPSESSVVVAADPVISDGAIVTENWFPVQAVTQASFEAAEVQRQNLVRYSQSRPKYAEISGTLSNFDADADPDGWRVSVVLRDSKDRPVVMRARASFELTPRVPTADFHSFVDATTSPVRWSMPVKFDDDGIARFKLPLQEKLRPAFGWNSAIYAGPGNSRVQHNRLHRRTGSIHRTPNSSVFGNLAANSIRTSLGRPVAGELRVRVSVPTEGVFEAATSVPLTPPSLVDTAWPYR